ncbi:MAG: class I SAM-dependent rRNA methyltransferase, partial [Gemmatimonadota bacterium]
RGRIEGAARRRERIDGTAYRVVHAEADGLPSLVVDRYGPCAVAQLLSAGLEAVRDPVLDAIEAVLAPEAIVLRHDVPVRRYERLPLDIEVPRGRAPERIEVAEGEVRFLVDPRRGQKTGAFLDQRENRALAGRLARGRALDAFTYEGGFALHLARSAAHVLAVDQSAASLARARENAALAGVENVEWREANAFDLLRTLEAEGARFDVVVLDPPAFAKSRATLPRALRGYKEINLRAMRLLAAEGHLLTFSCSYHVGRDAFGRMLADAAADSGRRIVLERPLGQSADHPEVLTIPETGYLKGALLRAAGA